MTTTAQQQQQQQQPADRDDSPEEELASLSSSASPEAATPPLPAYYESPSLSSLLSPSSSLPNSPPGCAPAAVEEVEVEVDPRRGAVEEEGDARAMNRNGGSPRGLERSEEELGSYSGDGLRFGAGPSQARAPARAAPVGEAPRLAAASDRCPAADRPLAAGAPPVRSDGSLADDEDGEPEDRPLTEEEERALLAAYEMSASRLRRHLSGYEGAGAPGNEGELLDGAGGDVPLTMEDADPDPEPPRRGAPAHGAAAADAAATANAASHSQSLRLLAEYESKVVLGSDAMLHHRRLPSTIYEESSEAATAPPLEANRQRRRGAAADPPGDALPRIASSGLNLSDLDSDGADGGDEFDYGDDAASRSNRYSHGSSYSSSSSSSFGSNHHQHQRPPSARDDPRRAEAPPGSQNGGFPLPPQPSSSSLSLSSGSSSPPRLLVRSRHENKKDAGPFRPSFASARVYQSLSARLLLPRSGGAGGGGGAFAATWIGFWALFHVTCVNYVLTPLRDAIAIKVGVRHIPVLTLASTGLAFVSSVPIGWLFEAPDPGRRKLWKRMGLTRGETQGTSLALFYRCFAVVLISYAVGFTGIERLVASRGASSGTEPGRPEPSWIAAASGKAVYVAFFLVVHLMKLHSLSLVWGVTTEAMEYEEVARKSEHAETSQTRLQRLALVGFGGTLGGIVGSGLASSMAHILKLPGLLILAAILLEVGAELSIELGRIMQKHWETQQLFQSSNDLASLDASMRRSVSLGSMKRVASGNSLSRVKSASDLAKGGAPASSAEMNDGTFAQRLLRGVTTILRSRLLMAIFTYNALYASTTVLLSFQRAELVANRNKATSAEANTAFLANINMASSIAIFALQASGLGAMLAHKCGPRGTLSLMPLVRLAGVLSLAWWHRCSSGQPPNLLVFLVVDECCKIMNLAVAKPVRESLWRGLSNEARYEAKPIVDTLANRWGGGSAAFLVSFIHHTLDWFGYGIDTGSVQSHERAIFGFPPILFLCMVISAWWTVVSADLGQIRSRIDIELKKRQ